MNKKKTKQLKIIEQKFIIFKQTHLIKELYCNIYNNNKTEFIEKNKIGILTNKINLQSIKIINKNIINIHKYNIKLKTLKKKNEIINKYIYACSINLNFIKNKINKNIINNKKIKLNNEINEINKEIEILFNNCNIILLIN